MFFSMHALLLTGTLLVGINQGLNHQVEKRQVSTSGCSLITCSNGGTCLSIPPNLITCACKTGFSGRNRFDFSLVFF